MDGQYMASISIDDRGDRFVCRARPARYCRTALNRCVLHYYRIVWHEERMFWLCFCRYHSLLSRWSIYDTCCTSCAEKYLCTLSRVLNPGFLLPALSRTYCHHLINEHWNHAWNCSCSPKVLARCTATNTTGLSGRLQSVGECPCASESRQWPVCYILVNSQQRLKTKLLREITRL